MRRFVKCFSINFPTSAGSNGPFFVFLLHSINGVNEHKKGQFEPAEVGKLFAKHFSYGRNCKMPSHNNNRSTNVRSTSGKLVPVAHHTHNRILVRGLLRLFEMHKFSRYLYFRCATLRSAAAARLDCVLLENFSRNSK
jgi:hypothetical protein